MTAISRIIVYTILPVLLALLHIRLSSTANNPRRQAEIFLIYLFGIGVGANGIGNAFGHLFLSDLVANTIGWQAGSPFQLEVGFANLGIGILGIIAMGRRDGFREATVISMATFAFGATLVHLLDIVQTGNLAEGNTWQNVSNLLRPTLAIGFLIWSRRLEKQTSDDALFDTWRGRHIQLVGMVTGFLATAFGIGLSLERPFIGILIGLIIIIPLQISRLRSI